VLFIIGNSKDEKGQPIHHYQNAGILKMSETNFVSIQLNGEKQVFILNKKDFKTGSRGYHAQGKMQVGDKRYQCNFLCVEIGSKPKDK
jgi:hypothetical protein